MRIVAGRHRGRNIIAPDGVDIRPTSDRVRESLFNVLEHRDWGKGGVSILSGARVLDAFCGTGACGLEALSRGAGQATFMDNNNTAIDLCRRNIAALEEHERSNVLRNNCLQPVRSPQPYDLIFLDPPYKANIAAAAMQSLSVNGWMAEGAICAVESSSDEQINPAADTTLLEDRKYGTTRVRIFQYAVRNDQA